MARQFQVDADPAVSAAHKVGMDKVAQAIRDANQSSGGSPVEMARAEYLVRSNANLKTVDDFRDIAVPAEGATLRLHQLANISVGAQPRRGVADLNGAGDVVGGIVVMRHGENALATVTAVKSRLEQLKKSLPAGVEIVTTYDRGTLIDRAVRTLRNKLLEESIAVAVICRHLSISSQVCPRCDSDASAWNSCGTCDYAVTRCNQQTSCPSEELLSPLGRWSTLRL